MAINKNHEFEELDGVKCGIVEKNVAPERVQFLKNVLEYNGFTVVVVASPPPKAAAPVVKAEGEEVLAAEKLLEGLEPSKSSFTVGVTDYTFNATNAIFGRLLKAKNGQVVTLAYWQQKENVSNDEVPYFETSTQ
jgi:hypothetical protein